MFFFVRSRKITFYSHEGVTKNKILDKAAYQIRKREEGTKTRILQRNFDLVLQKKPENDTEWHDVKVEIDKK